MRDRERLKKKGRRKGYIRLSLEKIKKRNIEMKNQRKSITYFWERGGTIQTKAGTLKFWHSEWEHKRAKPNNNIQSN